MYEIERVEGAMTQIANTQRESFFPTPGLIQDVIKSDFPPKPVPALPEPKAEWNPAAPAYAVWCMSKEQDWDTEEYKLFKADYAAGRVKVDRKDTVRGKVGRPTILGRTTVVWERGK